MWNQKNSPDLPSGREDIRDYATSENLQNTVVVSVALLSARSGSG